VCETGAGTQGQWFSSFVRYIGERHLGWCYWSANGTQSTAPARNYGDLDWYGRRALDVIRSHGLFHLFRERVFGSLGRGGEWRVQVAPQRDAERPLPEREAVLEIQRAHCRVEVARADEVEVASGGIEGGQRVMAYAVGDLVRLARPRLEHRPGGPLRPSHWQLLRPIARGDQAGADLLTRRAQSG